jgi:poly(3-hydroxybutyrate) depolymerase
VKRSLAEVVVLTAIVSACSSDHVLGGVEPGPSSPEASPDAGAPVTCDVGDWPTTPGPHDRTLTHQGVQRSYQVQIPSTYDPCKPSPVVVVLRGEGAFLAPDMTNGLTLFLNSAEARGYVALVPEATQVGLRVEWNAPLSSKKVQGVDDVGFIAAMLGETVGRDSARTHLAGHSAGGTFAHTLAASLPVFAAVLIVGGALGGRSPLSGALDIPPTPQSPVSVLLVHGRDDAIVPSTAASWTAASSSASRLQRRSGRPPTAALTNLRSPRRGASRPGPTSARTTTRSQPWPSTESATGGPRTPPISAT